MNPRSLTLATASLATVVGLTLTAGPAGAATHTHADPAKDVLRSSITAGGASAPTPAPTNKTADITSFKAAYAPAKVTLTATLRALATDNWGLVGEIKAAKPKPYQVSFAVQGKKAVIELTYNDTKVACKGLGYKIDRAHRSGTLTVPSTCLARPKSVRVGMAAFAVTGTGSASVYYVDDAQQKGDSVSSSAMVLGPRINRG